MVIAGAEDEEYRLAIDDIDSSLVFMYTPVTEEGAKGEPQYKYTDFIKAGVFWGNVNLLISFSLKFTLFSIFLYVDVLTFLCKYACL